jgi:eukaryotic-like serine/threonine-protein kinase
MFGVISRLYDMRYEVLERVGEGALFQVYKTRDKVTGRVVTLKTLQTVWVQDEALVQAFRKSMPDVKGLSHPNIARLEEVGEEDGAPYLVTEFVRGINLKDRIRRIAPFTLSVAVDFAISICEALQYGHVDALVHGDMRPHNIIVSPEGALKVTDFGLGPALAASQEAAAANLGRAVHYQAPEVAAGKAPTPSSDLYSLGVILFEMLTGNLPYPGETPLMVAQRHQADPIPSPRAINPGVPRSLEGIVMKALMKSPADRYRTAGDFLNDLKSVRDALRFGKPLSWSPLENEPAVPAGDGASAAGAAATGVMTTPVPPGPATLQAAPAATGAARMSATTTTSDDRISPYLKFALMTVIALLLTVGITGVAVWMATFAKPPEQNFPNLVGMKIEAARAAAEKVNVRLMEHDEYNDKFEGGTVYKVDPNMTGKPVRIGRSINVWISKGSRMVWVPNVVNLQKDEAEAKLKAAGLALGSVDRTYDKKVNYDYIVMQNPRAGKRVARDLPVNLIISDGPKPEDTLPPEPEPPAPDPSPTGDDPNSGITGDVGTTGGTGDTDARTVSLTKRIPKDGRGARRVRIEYDDTDGTHTAINEYHDEGELVSTKVRVAGSKLTVRVYYGEDSTPVSEATKTLPRNP